MLHSDYLVIIALFSPYCKVFSTEKVKILWKISTKFLKKSFFLLFLCFFFVRHFGCFFIQYFDAAKVAKSFISNVFCGFENRFECNTILYYVALDNLALDVM